MNDITCRRCLQAVQPVTWVPRLRGDCIDLRSKGRVLFVEHRVVKAIQVVNAKPEVTVRATLLVLDESGKNSFVLKQRRFSHG